MACSKATLPPNSFMILVGFPMLLNGGISKIFAFSKSRIPFSAIKCQTLWANYNLELLIGQIYENLQLYNNAENQYQLAHQMCPNRFLPLYHLALLFEKTQKRNKAVLLAQEIIIKPIKIPSLLIDNIKQEMNTYILNHSTK